VLEVALRPEAKIRLESLKEQLRDAVKEQLPSLEISFEPSSLVDRTMSQGSNTPIEIAVSGANITTDHELATKILNELRTLPFLRDLQIVQRLDYPTIEINANRQQLGYRGLSILQLGQTLIPATSSSRYVDQNYWRDSSTGINYQVQVEIPQQLINGPDSLATIPIQDSNGGVRPLSFYAKLTPGKKVGEYDRYDMQRMVSVSANLHDIDLGHASKLISKKIDPILHHHIKGTQYHLRGQITALTQMIGGLSFGLGLAILTVFLLLAANFESVSLSVSVLSTVPAVMSGSLLLLVATRTTLNIESFMGMIMSVGVAVANAILLVTFAERARKIDPDSANAAIEGARSRLRPILMTSGAMLVGMLPMASGLGEGGGQTAPLGRAVIGGILGSTTATLLILPLVFAWIQHKRTTVSASLNPDDST
jgi:multidrug efflux pump subunit AcrB